MFAPARDESLTCNAEVVDFQWNPTDPWTVLSVCDDVDVYCGGSNVQVWRVSDLIHRPEQEVLEELRQHTCVFPLNQ